MKKTLRFCELEIGTRAVHLVSVHSSKLLQPLEETK